MTDISDPQAGELNAGSGTASRQQMMERGQDQEPHGQADAWAGEFGNEYARRSPGDVRANHEFFRRALRQTHPWNGGRGIDRLIEFGAGVGNNLRALRQLLPAGTWMAGVEINDQAFDELSKDFSLSIHASMLECTAVTSNLDLAFTKGVLIHIPPADLRRAYEALHLASSRYILVAEYYSPKPVEIEYRGRRGMLWKRDFAGEMLDRYPDLRLLDYGFVYHRDADPQDDLNWFLMEKRQ